MFKKLVQFQDSTAVLSGNAVFTGNSITLANYNDGIKGFGYIKISVSVYASHASATNGLVIQGSNDNTTWYTAAQASVAATTPQVLEVALTFAYYRVKYTNGATLQTTFVINSALL